MPQLSSIEIDFDIHKLIETERRSFDEPPYVALRRLLKLPPLDPRMTIETPRGEGRPFVQDGVEVPHGSLARMEYQRGSQVYEGQFLDGVLVVNGTSYLSLSAAADALAVTKDGGKTSLNGWLYWKAKFPGESRWRSLKDLRNQHRKNRKL
ncbi:MAG: hypothetical protein Q8P46_09385 [Hyphomicrobiales bacterium]|nr:hypothetical protein [Hyphomicrobiales bacterium]